MSDVLKKAREALSRLNNSAWAGDLYAALDELERAEQREAASQARIAELEERVECLEIAERECARQKSAPPQAGKAEPCGRCKGQHVSGVACEYRCEECYLYPRDPCTARRFKGKCDDPAPPQNRESSPKTVSGAGVGQETVKAEPAEPAKCAECGDSGFVVDPMEYGGVNNCPRGCRPKPPPPPPPPEPAPGRWDPEHPLMIQLADLRAQLAAERTQHQRASDLLNICSTNLEMTQAGVESLKAQLAAAQARVKELQEHADVAHRLCIEREYRADKAEQALQAATERAERAERERDYFRAEYGNENAKLREERDAERKRADEWRKLQTETLSDLAKAAQNTAAAQAAAGGFRVALQEIVLAEKGQYRAVYLAALAREALAKYPEAP